MTAFSDKIEHEVLKMIPRLFDLIAWKEGSSLLLKWER
jgi:hypothetical protein